MKKPACAGFFVSAAGCRFGVRHKVRLYPGYQCVWNGLPPSLKPALMALLANQPWFISST